MDHHVPTGRRALVGVGMMAVGAVVGIVGLTAPAGAHESKDEPEEVPDGKSCPELLDSNEEWSEFVIDDVSDQTFTETYTMDDGGTETTDDDATVTVTVENGKEITWSSTVPIDGVYVQGRDTDRERNSYFFDYTGLDEEVTEDHDLRTPPYNQLDKNKIKSISFCWHDDETPPSTSPSSSSTSTSSTTSTSTSTSSTTTVPDSSTSSVAPTTGPTTTTPPTTSPDGDLPQTGSNTGLMVAIGAGLLTAGGILVATTRQLWRRHEARA